MNNDFKNFSFFNAKENDMLSQMHGIELQNLLEYLDNYYLDLKDNLGFDEDITFGLEIEFENADIDQIKESLSKQCLDSSWILKRDSSLNLGAEINSPILTDNINFWQQLKEVCNILKANAQIHKCCGAHVHVGTQLLGTNEQSWLNFIKLWFVYENIIYRFAYGNFLTARPSINKYAPPIAKQLYEDYQKLVNNTNLDILTIKNQISHSRRYQAVNFTHVWPTDTLMQDNTIEFRCPNGTLDPVIWQNNVNLFVNLLKYCSSSSFDDDIIKQRMRLNKDDYLNIKFYDEIFLGQSLEFADMIFNTNLDKMYFLRQYLKSFQTFRNDNQTIQFTKKI